MAKKVATNELLDLCRYFKEEKECPYKEQNKRMLWDCERLWFIDTIRRIESKSEKGNPMLDDYLDYGLVNFKGTDGVPITLKAALFAMYCKTSYSVRESIEPFKKFYSEYYG